MLSSIRYFTLICVLSSASMAWAQPGVVEAKGTGLCHFTLHNYPLSAASGATINRIVTDLLRRHEAAFNFTAPTNFRVKLRIFGSQPDYLAFARTNRLASGAEAAGSASGPGLDASNLAGYYSSRNKEIVTWRQREPSYLANNILHECSHAIMNEQFPYLPIWLSEGCAVYFSFPLAMQDADDRRTLKLRWEALGYWLKENKLPPLKTFLNAGTDQFRALDTQQAYTVSWSVFQFLMATPDNRKALNKFVDIIQDTEQDPVDCAGILGDLYPGGLPRFERDWHIWIRQRTTTPKQPTSS